MYETRLSSFDAYSGCEEYVCRVKWETKNRKLYNTRVPKTKLTSKLPKDFPPASQASL